ncbi:MAG TPA: VWA domain-containing protein [Verrucomicrobiae bacterium]|jgi:Ca-activated chloride channel family protein|nr:VWA domain-containing protein [Verrucomicrobiae bacterium]
MTFAHPYVLLLLLLLPVLAWLKGKLGQAAAFVYSSVDLVRPIAGLRRSRAGAILADLRWLALALFIFALAQPRLVRGESHVKASGIDIVVALDMSGSMRSEDFGEGQSRIKLAKEVLGKFIDNRPNDRIGLVAFAREAYIASPPTLDHDYLQHQLDRLQIGVIDENATAIGSALMTALNRIKDLKDKSKIVILMTDGENNSGKISPLTAADAAQALGVKVYTIGIGKQGTAPYPIGRDQWGRTITKQVPVDIDEETLTKIAQQTNGKYYRADTADTLRRIYADIDRLETTEVEVKKYQHYDELFGQATIGGLAVLLLEMILAQTVWRKLP